MNRNSPAAGRLLLLLCAVIWGSGFIVVKNALDGLPLFTLLALRFGGGCAVLSLVFFRRLRRLTPAVLGRGAIAGLLQALAFGVQSYGLSLTTPGKNAFLTAVYCPLVPFVLWLWKGKRPAPRHVIACLVCLLGIGLISLSDTLSIDTGDAFSLLCGLCFALHVSSLQVFSRECDAVLLTIVQAFFSSLSFAVAALLTHESLPAALPQGMRWLLAYLIVFPTALCVLLQNVGQAMTPAAPAAILLSLESVFGALLSVLLGMDQPTPRLLLGFAVVFSAVLIGELGGGRGAEF